MPGRLTPVEKQHLDSDIGIAYTHDKHLLRVIVQL